MSHFSTMSSEGQLTVPQEIRKRLGLETGDRVEFVMEEGRTVIRPARSEANPFEKFTGIPDPFPGGEEG
jgi:antitoxin PrlF